MGGGGGRVTVQKVPLSLLRSFGVCGTCRYACLSLSPGVLVYAGQVGELCGVAPPTLKAVCGGFSLTDLILLRGYCSSDWENESLVGLLCLALFN